MSELFVPKPGQRVRVVDVAERVRSTMGAALGFEGTVREATPSLSCPGYLYLEFDDASVAAGAFVRMDALVGVRVERVGVHVELVGAEAKTEVA